MLHGVKLAFREEVSGKAVERALPVISYDFFYTGMDPQPVDEQGEHDHTKNLCCLVITDSASGFVHCVPVDSKLKRFRHIVVEIVLGYSEVCLRNDQEPFLLRVQSQVQKVRREQGHRTILENPAVGDSQGNGRVESAVHQIRQQANVLLHHVRERTGLEINHQHSIFAWAFVHSAFLISRFATRAGCTPFELIAGRPFQGALAVFAEPVMAYVAVSGMSKGKAKWQRAVALTKSGLNDMYIVACSGTICLTRSVRRCFDNWKDALEQFQQVNVKIWELEGVIGARMAPSVLKKAEPLALGIPSGILGRGDEAASDPPSENEKDQRQKDAEQAGNKQAGEKATLKQIPPLLNASSSGGGSAGASSAAMPMEVTVLPDDTPLDVFIRDKDVESASKKLRVQSVEQQAQTEFASNFAHMEQNDFGEAVWNEEDWIFLEQEDEAETVVQMQEKLMWPRSDDKEPELTDVELQECDDLAEKAEVQRLCEMGVLVSRDSVGDIQLDTPLSAKYVKTWRAKEVDGQKVWLRRARLVAREFNFLQERSDVYSPASPASPAICNTEYRQEPCQPCHPAFNGRQKSQTPRCRRIWKL